MRRLATNGLGRFVDHGDIVVEASVGRRQLTTRSNLGSKRPGAIYEDAGYASQPECIGSFGKTLASLRLANVVGWRVAGVASQARKGV